MSEPPNKPSLDFPASFGEVGSWARERGVGVAEARLRFAQYVVLRAIASSISLRRILVFKGGNALDFVWSPNRSTLDLDFSADMAAAGAAKLGETRLGELLSGALDASGRELGVLMRVHSVRRQPPGEGKTFVTYTARIGYALPGDRRNRTLLEAGQSSQYVVPVEVSINEPIGADKNVAVGDRSLRVGTLDDIGAEKLRAFLQQKGEIRNRTRPQDLLDIAYLLYRGTPLNLDDVSRFLLTKAEARNVPVSKSAFRDPELAKRANTSTTGCKTPYACAKTYVPFDEALEALYDLIESSTYRSSRREPVRSPYLYIHNTFQGEVSYRQREVVKRKTTTEKRQRRAREQRINFSIMLSYG